MAQATFDELWRTMRVETKGIKKHQQPFQFDFEGKTIDAFPGDTIASALISAGIWDFRQSKHGTRRGVFCGMGVCGDCQVRIGDQSRRACLEPARENLEITQYRSREMAPAVGKAPRSGDWLERKPDVLIIGAGPAGLSAARIAAEAGLDVLVVDERQKAGGQYFKQPGDGYEVDFGTVDAQFVEGHRLALAALNAGAKFVFGATVWGTFAPHRVAIVVDGNAQLIAPQRLILSPGAYERAFPFPGWTLPGVLTTGAAQTLLRAYQTAPGRRVLIAGNGPLNLQVASELTKAGVTVAAVAELAASPYTAPPGAILSMSLNAPRLLFAGMQHLLSLQKNRVPVLYRHALIAAEGDDKVQRAVTAQVDERGKPLAGTEQVFDVDAVCINDGFLPQSELARSLGCTFCYDGASGKLDAVRGDDGRTNVDHVFIVGDAGSMGGARVAMEQGALAGLSVIEDLKPSVKFAGKIRRCERSLRRHKKFQNALWRVFDAPFIGTGFADSSTLICRCEEISKADVERCLQKDDHSFASVKRTTRLGMGRCQGRYCTNLLASLMRETLGNDCDVNDFFAPRAPFKPVPISQLAGAYGQPLKARDLLKTRDE